MLMLALLISWLKFGLRFICQVEWPANSLVGQILLPMALANINIAATSAPRSGYNSVKSESNSKSDLGHGVALLVLSCNQTIHP